MSTLLDLDHATLVNLFRKHTASPVELIHEVIGKIEAMQPLVNAFVSFGPDEAMLAAKASEQRWKAGAPLSPYDGLVATIKTNISVKGWPRQQGSAVSSSAPMEFDAPAVARLREAGVIIAATTTMPEFGWKGLSDSPLTGQTVNPWDRTRSTGGSSAGAAAAAALGIGHFHLGTDGAGSVRIPAAFCGVVGLKPSYGRVPAYPSSLMGELAHLGPLTRSVSDAAAMMTMIAQPDKRDNTSNPAIPPDYRLLLNKGVCGLRIGYSANLGFVERIDPAIARMCREAIAVFEQLGAHVEEVDLAMDDPFPILKTLWFGGAANILTNYSEEQIARMDPGFVEIAREGATIPASAYVNALFPLRNAMVRQMNAFHERFDLLVTPQLSVTALPVGGNHPPSGFAGVENWSGHIFNWTPFTYPFNITQQPACSVPCGLAPDGLPVAIQIVGPLYEDGLVLQAAAAFEAVKPMQRIHSLKS